MSTPPLPDFGNLDPIATQLGLLVGLLQPGAKPNTYSLNLDWFKDPLPALKNIPTETDTLLTLLEDILGTPASNSPDGRVWYPIQSSSTLSNCYVVLPKDSSDPTAIIGLGIMHPYVESGITITPNLYFPLFSLPVSGNPFVLGQADTPIEVNLNLKATQRFAVDSVSFDGLQFGGKICFAGTGSGFVLNFLDIQPTDQQSSYTTITDLLNSAVDKINAVLSNSTVTAWLNQQIGTSNETLGSLLIAMKLLQQSGTQYQLGDLSTFIPQTSLSVSQTPLTIVENFCFTALNKLASNTKPLVPVSNGGVYVVSEAVSGGTDYGLRLQIPDLAIPASSENSPQLTLQFGKWLTGEDPTKNTTWLNRAAPSLPTIPAAGVSLYLMQEDSSNALSFQPEVKLVSLGFDYQGGNNTPLINIDGVQLAGFESRFFISIDPETISTIPWGVALRCDNLGLPLGSGLSGSTGDNPIAQNLLDSGSGDSNGGDPQPVNPTFSAAIAYSTYSTTFDFQLYDTDGTMTDTVLLPMQRAFGPLHCQKIGVGWQDAAQILSFLFYGGVSLSALDVELEGLSIGLPLTSPAQLDTYQFALNGLDISLAAGPVEISGGLLEIPPANNNNNIEYDGEALIQAGSFSISALGSYTTLNGQPSLFLFAFLNDPLGGPPPFFVTGLCAGFGYNRSLTIPPVDQVQTFPLVAGLSDSSQIGGQNATPAQALAALESFVPPTQGENWLAAGVQFNSFELIHSHALAVAEFGKEFELAILGLSAIKLPAEGTETFTYAELELEVVLKPSEGEFSAIALLTPNSYVLDPECHLTGGFAFCVWFGNNPHAGDFVLTIGGYHPQFTAPAWYPAIPRLGFNWSVSSKISISGDAYFALTPSCVMGGGGLQLLFHDGGLKAWFKAQADFLITWKPFSYNISVGISMGVAYTFKLFGLSSTLKVEVGAALAVWGPTTAGYVKIKLSVITFTVSFGPGHTTVSSYTDWNDFKSLLPQKTQPATSSSLSRLEDDPTIPETCTIQVNSGLLSQASDGSWLVRADGFTFSAQTAAPLTALEFDGQPIQPPSNPAPSTQTIGIRPMGLSQIASSVTVQVVDTAGKTIATNLSYVYSQQDMPEALWGQPLPSGQTPTPSANLLNNLWTGLEQICLISPNSLTNAIDINVANGLGYDRIDPSKDYLPISAATKSINNPPQASTQVISIISSTVNSTDVQAKRTSVFNALAALGINAGSDGDLTNLASNVGFSYQADPLLGSPEAVAV